MPALAPLVAGYGRRWPRNQPGPFGELAGRGAGRPPNDRLANGLPLLLRVFVALGADLTADPSTWEWTDISQYVRYQQGIDATTGRRDEAGLVTAGKASLTLDNRDGRWSRKNPTGPYYGRLTRNTPLLVTVNAGAGDYRAVEMFVTEWPARWTKGVLDVTVPIVAAGILRRLEQGDPIGSALYRSNIATGPIAYWPLESGSDAAFGANAVVGGMPLTWTGTDPTRAFGGPPGSDPLWTVANDTDLFGVIPPYTPTTAGWWGFQFVYHLDQPTLGAGITLIPVVEIRCGGTIPKWRITIDTTWGPDAMVLEGFNSSDVRVVAETFFPNSIFADFNPYGHDIIFGMNIHQEGGNIRYDGAMASPDDVLGGTSANVMFNNTIAGTNGNVTSVRFPAGYTTARPNWVFGHISVWGKQFTLYNNQMNGYTGESAYLRIARLCAEEGVQLSGIGDLYDPVADPTTQPMGPQTAKGFLALLRECEAADGGTLWEYGHGLAYQPRWTRYNAPVDLALDIDRSHVADEPQPTDDDQRLRNRWKISRVNGASATAEDVDSITAEGLHPDQTTVNVQADSQLSAAANWLVHLGTVDDLRWPAIGLNFSRAAAAELIDAYGTLKPGARLILAGIPTAVQPDAADLFIEGKHERIDQFLWQTTLTCSPGTTQDVLRLNEPDRDGRQAGRIGLSQTLAADIGTSDTSVSLASTGPLMATTAAFPAEFPYDIVMEGERMTVTDVSGASSPQTVTVVRSVNGVAKTHTAGAAVALWRAGVVGR
jgi:hypothetical protein